MYCLILDPIGEEERHIEGKMGTRAHDLISASTQADSVERLIMGKLVFDTIRGIDFLSLSVPRCALMVLNGVEDNMINPDLDPKVWSSFENTMSELKKVYEQHNQSEKLD